eukprot:contig_20613_g5064
MDPHDLTLDLDIGALLQDQKDLEAASAVAAHLAVMRRIRRRARASRRAPRCRFRGSPRGRGANKQREFPLGVHLILKDYFSLNVAPPVYSESDFERRFRVPRQVFVRIYRALCERPWWKQSINATGRLQSH